MAAAVCVPLSVALAVVVWVPFAALAAVPAVVMMYPELKLRDAASKRREDVERALPFFSVLVNVMGGAGLSLFTIFESLASTDLFAPLRKEALRLQRDVEVFGMDPNQALERLAATHPSAKLRAFLYGYTSKVRSGGDMVGFLTGESEAMIRGLEGGWARYTARSGVVGSLMVTVFGVLPLLLMIVGVFSPSAAVVGLLAFTAVAVPLFTIVLVLMAGRMQPSGDSPVGGKLLRSALLASAAAGAGLLTRLPWVAAALALFVFFVAYGLSVRSAMVALREAEAALPRFMEDVLEFKRQESGLGRAVVAISSGNRYNDSFDRLLRSVAAQLKAGRPLDEVKFSTDCSLAKVTFFLLGEMERTGGGTVDTVYQLAHHTRRVAEMKGEARAEMRPYLVLSYLSPLLLAFGVTFVRGVLSSYGGTFKEGVSSATVHVFQIGVFPPELSQVSDLLIVVSAAALGVIGAKMTDFTVRSTLKASANVAVATGALALLASAGGQALFHF